MNKFLDIATNRCYTENGAASWSTTNSVIVDQFGKAANYRGRDITEVFADQEALWNANAEMALRFPFYLRMVTRKIKINVSFITDKVQNGQGARDESFKRLLWIATNHPTDFYNNLWVLPMVGSWKDLFQIMHYDMEYEQVLEWKKIFELLKQGMACSEHVELIKKYMPRIKSERKLKTVWTINMNTIAKELAIFMGWSVKEYNKFKSTGTAHEFQKNICRGLYDKINWNAIPGRALNLLVSGNFLKNHNLVDSYTQWLDKQPVAKYTGYVYELGHKVNANERLPLYKKHTIDKQFQSLIEQAQTNGKIKENVWCALDTSGSMNWSGINSNSITALDICMSLGIFFSTLNQGAFHKNVIMFDWSSTVKQLKGTFTEMMKQIPRGAMGGTNFQSVVDEICRIRTENPNIPLEDYPTTILTVSDMQFNEVNSVWDAKTKRYLTNETNYEAMKRQLYDVFPSEFVDAMKFIWWDVTSIKIDFPARIEDGGCYMISGFDGSIVTMLLGEEEREMCEKTPKTMEELVEAALTQEILLQVKLS